MAPVPFSTSANSCIECECCNVLILPLCMFRLRAPINRLTTLDNNGNQNVFFREAPLANASSPIILPGPGKFQEAVMYYIILLSALQS